MNILVLDDDIYLGLKVTSRLLEDGYHCDNHACISEVNLGKSYDAVLLSTNLPSDDCNKIIKKYSNSIIILLVTYVSDATVTKPIKAGADDYVLKPFSMDELIRKIKHFGEFKKIEKEAKQLKEYFDFLFRNIENDDIQVSYKAPVLVETNDQKYSDKLAFDIAKQKNKTLKFVTISNMLVQTILNDTQRNDQILYVTDFHTLKKSFKTMFIEHLYSFDIIISSLENEDEFIAECEKDDKKIEKVEIKNSNQLITNDNIMTINDYVKLIVTNFQYKYPDTELSKKLGISRKSLWEKRKKLDIEKKK
jgi:DNA-binding NtrC family response regulator